MDKYFNFDVKFSIVLMYEVSSYFVLLVLG